MKASLSNVGRALGRLVWLVPGILAVQHVGPSGVQTAEACTGGVPGEGWQSLGVASAAALERVPIATDGFVLLEGSLLGRGINPQDPDVWVRVTDENGAELPGQLRLLRSDSNVREGTMQVHLGWQSDQPLAVGTLATLSWAAGEDELGAGGVGSAPQDAESLELEVVGEPTPLPTPTALLGPWVDVRHGVGDLVECVYGESDCGPIANYVPTRETQLVGVATSWELPVISGMVAWELRAEVRDVTNGHPLHEPRDGIEAPARPRAVIARRTRDGEVVEAGIVAFADHATDHCAELVVKDLRTGEESRSASSCDEPSEPTLMLVDHYLRDCVAPPTLESKALWCEGREETAAAICAETGQAGAGPISGSGQLPEKADDSQEPGADPSADDDSAHRPRTSRGCQLAPANGSSGLAAATLGVLISLLSRRRRKSP